MSTSAQKIIRIGGACGYWGESAMATPQLLAGGGLDYIVYDYLAEITMSILARAKAKDPAAGYAKDFIGAVLKPNLKDIAHQGVKIIANAGGVHPKGCAEAARTLIREQELDLKVAVIEGDDLMSRKNEIAATAPKEMFASVDFPDPEKIASINAYLGAFPIARALTMGADIVITGRAVDSAATLGPCIYEFGWAADDWDRLAAGALAGHVLECGPQATGGNFTDWEEVGDIADIGYPIAEIEQDGSFVITKPEGTGGIVNIGTVSEQLLYEISDPQNYILPDVICDFSDVVITETDPDHVRVVGAKGRPSPSVYKTSLTYEDGWRAGVLLSFTGFDAEKKAQVFADAAFARARNIFRKFNAGDFTETSIEVLGAESQYGEYRKANNPREVVAKIAAKHPAAMGVGVLLKEIAGLGLATPPGLSIFAGARPKPSPVVRLFSFLTPKEEVDITIDIEGDIEQFTDAPGAPDSIAADPPAAPAKPAMTDDMTEVPLIKLAWARSGDKGDKANIGVIARREEYLPYIWAALDEEAVANRFAHFIAGDADASRVQRFYLRGPKAINFVIDSVLGEGGVASIRNDPQGKAFGQILLAHPVSVPATLLGGGA